MTSYAASLSNKINLSFGTVNIAQHVQVNWNSFISESKRVYTQLALKAPEVLAVCGLNEFLHVRALALQAKIDANAAWGISYRPATPQRVPELTFPQGVDSHLKDWLSLIGMEHYAEGGLIFVQSRHDAPKITITAGVASHQQVYEQASLAASGMCFPWYSNSQAVLEERNEREMLRIARMIHRLPGATLPSSVQRIASTYEESAVLEIQAKLRAHDEHDASVLARTQWENAMTQRTHNIHQFLYGILAARGTTVTDADINQLYITCKDAVDERFPLAEEPRIIDAPHETRDQLVKQLVGAASVYATPVIAPVNAISRYPESTSSIGANLYWDHFMLNNYDQLMLQFGTFIGREEFDRKMVSSDILSTHLCLLNVYAGLEYDSVYATSPLTKVDSKIVSTALIHQPYLELSILRGIQCFKTGDVRGITQFRNGITGYYTSISPTPKVNVTMPYRKGITHKFDFNRASAPLHQPSTSQAPRAPQIAEEEQEDSEAMDRDSSGRKRQSSPPAETRSDTTARKKLASKVVVVEKSKPKPRSRTQSRAKQAK